jgi:hypothetical protein
VKVNGPDGRLWTVVRRTDPPSMVGSFLPGQRWLVEATAPDEQRVWIAASRGAARAMVAEVALALRTGAEGPPGEIDPRSPEVSADASESPEGIDGTGAEDD